MAKPAQVINSFAITPASVNAGGAATLAWSTSRASAVYLNGARVAALGSKSVAPSATTAYRLDVDGPKPRISKTVTLTMKAVPAPAPAPTTTPPPTPAPTDDAAWTALSANRILARRLLSADAADANLAGRHPTASIGVWYPVLPDGTSEYNLPVIDSDGLRFDVITGKRIPDWYADLGARYGANSTLYVQWKQRFNQAFIDTLFKTTDGKYPGIKLAVLSSISNTSDLQKLVVSTYGQHRFPYLYQYDPGGGGTSNLDSPPGGMQPRMGEATTCFAPPASAPEDQVPPGCVGLVADKDITFDLIVQTGGLIPGTNAWDCRRTLYMTIDGVRRLVIDFGPGMPGYTGRVARAFEAIWFAPYMTDRDITQVYVGQPSTTYRDLIADDKPIGPLAPTGTTQPPNGTESQMLESPDGSRVPPLSQFIDAAGKTWAMAGDRITRDGAVMPWGACLAVKLVAHEVWIQGDSTMWYPIIGNGLGAAQSTEPGTAQPPPLPPPPTPPDPVPIPPPPPPTGESPNGARVPPLAQFTAAGKVWGMSAGKITRDDVTMSAWGTCLAVKKVDPDVWIQGDSGTWYRVSGNNLVDPTNTEPGGTVTPPPQGGAVPLFTPTRDGNGVVTNYGSLPLNTWHEINDTKMTKLLPQLPAQSNASDMNNVLASWGSAAHDPATGNAYLHGGAHGANAENSGWYAFNSKKADWKIAVAPLYMGAAEAAYLNQAAALVGGNQWDGSYNVGMPPDYMFLPVPGSVTGAPTLANPNATSSGKVFAHHCWHKLVWVDWIGTGRCFVSLLHLYLLDPLTGEVTLKQKHADTNFQYNTADPVTKRVYGLTNFSPAGSDYWGFREYDPVADTMVEHPITIVNNSAHFGSANVSCIVGREIVFYNATYPGWFAFNMDTKVWRLLQWQPLPTVAGAGEWSMVAFDGKIIATQGFGNLQQIDPSTGDVSAFPTQGPAVFGSASQNGLFGRFFLQDGLLFAIDWATTNVKVMRLQ